jgi:KUP system potassium uptake protein
MEYKVKMLVPNDIYHLTFNLGFRVQPKVDRFFRTVVEELTTSGELVLEKTPDLKYSLNLIGDHKFILGDSFLSYDNKLSQWKNLLLKSYYSLKKIAVREEENFGLDESNVLVEKYPLVVAPVGNIYLKRLVNQEENA